MIRRHGARRNFRHGGTAATLAAMASTMAPKNRRSGNGTTIAFIAAQAGVSVPTVSKVINGRSDVAPETRKRVETAIREHGYQRIGRIASSAGARTSLFVPQLDRLVLAVRGTAASPASLWVFRPQS